VPPRCTLCGNPQPESYLVEANRRYHRCATCSLIFLDPSDHLRPLEEVLRYLEHDNRGDDPAYVAFLRRLTDWVENFTAAGSRGLDYGCGPAPVLGEILTSSGRPTASYDPLFRPDESLLSASYDFVTCCEVVEHAHDPALLFETLRALVAPRGLLAVMTRMPGYEAPFERWWYRRDPTHVAFYPPETMHWIAARYGWSCEIPVPHVALFTVGATATPESSMSR
jgi:SAM-dependent methyltransferase